MCLYVRQPSPPSKMRTTILISTLKFICSLFGRAPPIPILGTSYSDPAQTQTLSRFLRLVRELRFFVVSNACLSLCKIVCAGTCNGLKSASASWPFSQLQYVSSRIVSYRNYWPNFSWLQFNIECTRCLRVSDDDWCNALWAVTVTAGCLGYQAAAAATASRFDQQKHNS